MSGRVENVPLGGSAAERGVVYLVGGGPGDPGLLSLRAARLLSTATLIAYDRLAPAAALDICREGAERVYVGKLPQRHALAQPEINALLVSKAAAGEAVVRFKGGDPFVFGRGSEEAQACRAAGIPYEIVPGVTSGIAGPAYAGIPVTHRGLASAFAVVTGHEDPTKRESQVDYEALAAFPGTLVLLMGIARLGATTAELLAAGRPESTPVAVVQWASTPRQRTVVATLGTIAKEVEARGIGPPAVTIIGQVAALSDELAWFEAAAAAWVAQRRPLHGVRVLVPRTRHQASVLSERLRALGADPVEAPTIAIDPGRQSDALRMQITRARDGAFDWMALTSANAVTAIWEQVRALDADARLFGGLRIAAVGPGTSEALRARGLEPDLVPERYTTAGLAEALIGTGPGGRVLLPRADIATPVLRDALEQAGWETVEVEAYRTVAAAALDGEVREQLRDGGMGAIAFASSSTARNLVHLLGGVPHPNVRVATIGPITTEACRELGLPINAEAEPHDLDGLVQAVVRAVRTPNA